MATSPTLPASTKPYGTTTFLDPTGLLWFGTVALEFTSVYSKDAVDSLIAGIGGNLQSVTDEGNTTTNAIQITNYDNIDPSVNSLALYNTGTGLSYISNTYGTIETGLLNFSPTITALSKGSTNLFLGDETVGVAGAAFTTRVSGSDAINGDEFTTLGQITTSLGSFVPYIGATSNVNLGSHSLLFQNIDPGNGTYNNTVSPSEINLTYTPEGGANSAQAALSAEAGLYLKTRTDIATGQASLRSDLLTVNRNFQFPNADGTLALTSNLSSYVPYTGATGNVNLGSNNITSNSFIKSGGTSSQFLKADGSVDGNTYQNTSQKNQANGYAGLDSGVKIFLSQLPDSILGALIYQGTWNATTNSPTLANPPSSDTKGYYYVTNTAGTQFGITFAVGDWIVSNGTEWQKVDNSDAVTTVFGRLGNVVANESDYSSFYPLLNGTGATGTWGINISGNAETVTNGVYTTGSYADPSWITSLAYSKLTGAPNLSGYELLANKQNSLATDGTGVKYPTVDAVNSMSKPLSTAPVLIEQFISGFFGRGMLTDEPINIISEQFVIGSSIKGAYEITVSDISKFTIGGNVTIKHDNGLYKTYFITSKNINNIGILPGLLYAVSPSTKIERTWFNRAHPGKFYMRELAQRISNSTELQCLMPNKNRVLFTNFAPDQTLERNQLNDIGGAVINYYNYDNLGSDGTVNTPARFNGIKNAYIEASTINAGCETNYFKVINPAITILSITCSGSGSRTVNVVNEQGDIIFTDNISLSAVPRQYRFQLSTKNSKKIKIAILNSVSESTVTSLQQIDIFESNTYNDNIIENKSGVIVGLGDSWIEGDLISTPERESILTQLRLELPYATIINKGHGGDKIQDLLARFDTDVIPNNPDYVIINVGTNDAYSPASGIFYPNSVDFFNQKMNELIGKILSINAKPIIIGVPALSQSDAEVPSFDEWLLNDRARQFSYYNYQDLLPLFSVLDDYLPLVGGNISGQLTLSTAPTNPTDVVRLTDLSGYLPLTGGTLTGALNYEVGNNRAQLTSDYFRIYNVVDQKSIIMRQSTGLSINTSGNIASAGIFKTDNLTGDRVYQGPNASGILALTSDLANYVNTTGSQIGIAGNKQWLGDQVISTPGSGFYAENGTGGTAFMVSAVFQSVPGGTSPKNFTASFDLGIILNTGTTSGGDATLRADNLTTGRTFQFPNAAGTLALIPDVSVTSTSLYTIPTTNSSYNTFSGTTSTWTLPTIASNSGKRVVIINRGSGNITLNSNAGGSDIDESGVYSAIIVVPPATTLVLVNNSLKWVIVN